MGPKRDREVNIFNVSMLDVITGALGAFLILTALSVPFLPAKQLEAELDKAQNTVVELSSTLVKLTEPNTLNSEQSADDVREAFIAAQADLTERQARIEGLQADLSLALENKDESIDLELENQQLRAQIAELALLQTELVQKNQELAQVQAELSALALRVPEPTPTVDSIELSQPLVENAGQNNVDELISENNQLNQLLSIAQNSELTIRTELAALQTELQERSERLASLEADLQVTELRLADALLKAPEVNDIVTPDLTATLELELNSQNEKILALEEQLASLALVSSENTALQQELERLKSINAATLASATDQNAMQTELTNLSNTFAELERTKLALEANLQAMQTELNAAKTERDTLANNVAQLQENYANAEASRAAQERELTDLRLESQNLQSQNTSVAEARQQSALLAGSLQAQLDQSQALVTQMSQEKQQVDARLGELERERDLLSAQLASTQVQAQNNQELASSLSSLTAERDSLQAQLQRATTDATSYTQALADRQASIDSLQQQLNTLSLQASQASTAQSQVQSYQQQNADLTQRLSQLETSMSQVMAERDTFQRESASLQTSLQQASAAAAAASAVVASSTNSLFAMISWDKPADVDLTVIDPNGLNFNAADSSAYRQDSRSGAEILIDSQRGPGSEIWYTPTIQPGTYKVRANVYAPRLAGDDEPIPVNINLVHQNNGRRATALTVDLQYFTKNCMEVAHINVTPAGQLSINQVMQPCGAKEDNTPKNYLQGIDNGAGN